MSFHVAMTCSVSRGVDNCTDRNGRRERSESKLKTTGDVKLPVVLAQGYNKPSPEEWRRFGSLASGARVALIPFKLGLSFLYERCGPFFSITRRGNLTKDSGLHYQSISV